MSIIEFKNVSKVYPTTGTVALRNVSFSIEQGEFIFLVGESGAGKSTIFKLLTREELPTSGRVLLDNYNICSLKEAFVPLLRRQMGMIFQDFRLIDTLTVSENVAFAMEIIGEPREKIRQRVPIALSVVGLRNKKDVYPGELSGGEAQRVCIARAIVNRPKLIIADEPTGDLDPLNGESIMALLERININNGTTVLTCSHDRTLINKMRKRVIEIQHGVLIRDEPCGQYFPEQESARKFIPVSDLVCDLQPKQSVKAAVDSEALLREEEMALDILRMEDAAEAERQNDYRGKSGIRTRSVRRFGDEEKRIEATESVFVQGIIEEMEGDGGLEKIAGPDCACDGSAASAERSEKTPAPSSNRFSNMTRSVDFFDRLRERAEERKTRPSVAERRKDLTDRYERHVLSDAGDDVRDSALEAPESDGTSG